MSLADLMRLICAAEALVLIPMCFACLVGPMTTDQRLRYAALALIGFVVVAGQIDAWGRPGNWRMPLLAVALAMAVTGTGIYLARRRRSDRE